MTRYKPKMLLSLLLALVMIVTMLPMTALAAEASDEAHTCTDENCTHDHEAEVVDVDSIQDDVESEELPVSNTDETLIEETPMPEATESPETPVETSAYSGHVGDSEVLWELDPVSGRLFITGSGYVEPFYTPEEQPWHEVREQISSVRFDFSATTMKVLDLCYWFDGCINLSDVAISVYVWQISPSDFADCASLCKLTYGGVDVLDIITADYDAQSGIEMEPENSTADGSISLFSSSNCGVTRCTCTGSCQWGYSDYQVAPESNNRHVMVVYCLTCGRTDGIVATGNHSYGSNGYCSLCGYYNSAYDQTSVCYHNSTYKSWSGCNWTEYCSSCGAYISSGTSHGSTNTTWSGCNWYDYCRDCGQLMNSGVSHSYSYGSWTYYNSSRHSRTGTCTYCGATTTSYGYHSTSTKYSPYSSTQHSYGSYCSTCGSYIGAVSYASHSLSYGSWQNYSGTQHRRTVSCSTCGYSTYEYANHSLTSGSWSSISATQHRRTLSCSCGYSTTETANHTLTYGVWASVSDTQHQRTGTCSCGYSTSETVAHTDANDDGCCDDCEYLMTRFSVTVPASLTMTVSKYGEVYTADNAVIVNNSTGTVAISGVTIQAENGWTLVPYSSNMANTKVDSKLIGFSLNGAQSAVTGTTESLLLPGAWAITKGASLPLTYDAVVSALSQPVSEQVLTVVFMLEWAVK